MDSRSFRDLGKLYHEVIVGSEDNEMYYDTLKFKISSGGGGTIDQRIITECILIQSTVAMATVIVSMTVENLEPQLRTWALESEVIEVLQHAPFWGNYIESSWEREFNKTATII